MATVNVVRLSDKDVERLAAALAEKTGARLAEIVTRLTTIEDQLAKTKVSRAKSSQKGGRDE